MVMTLKGMQIEVLMTMEDNMYQNYIFDFYGTLVDIKCDETSKEVWGGKMALYMGYQGAVYNGESLKKNHMRNMCQNIWQELKEQIILILI